MSEAAKTRATVVLGLLFLMSGIAGVAVGHSAAPAGWWMICVGLVLAILGWRRLGDPGR
jgi:uncharacterized membrane protein HdeD (DUF308 family)